MACISSDHSRWYCRDYRKNPGVITDKPPKGGEPLLLNFEIFY
jgi:hypothetical protein